MLQTLRTQIRQWFQPDNNLVPYSVVQTLQPLSEHHLGLRAIEVKAVIGSVDRHADFDRQFRPKSAHLDARWLNMKRLFEQGQTLPAIQVIQVGSVFFVRDGNHRVSVARHLGQAYLDAEVTQVEVKIPLDVGKNGRNNAKSGTVLSP